MQPLTGKNNKLTLKSGNNTAFTAIALIAS